MSGNAYKMQVAKTAVKRAVMRAARAANRLIGEKKPWSISPLRKSRSACTV